MSTSGQYDLRRGALPSELWLSYLPNRETNWVLFQAGVKGQHKVRVALSAVPGPYEAGGTSQWLLLLVSLYTECLPMGHSEHT